MVYRLGKRIKPWRRRVFEKTALITVVGVLCTVGSAYAANRKGIIMNGSGTHASKQASAKNGSGKSKSKYLTRPRPKGHSQPTQVIQADGALVSKECGTTLPIHEGLTTSYVPELRKLAEYETVCSGEVTNKVMTFLAMPANANEATKLAKDASYTLKEMSQFGITPLVVFEPQTSQGFIDFASYQNGGYDVAMDAYFATLKTQGITDTMMGMWVLFPESNIPEWGNTNPKDVSACITKTAQFQKKYFPSSKASVLFDSKSYPSGNSWDGGSYASLAPYVQDIPKGLIDSFGLQGYPWPDVPADYNADHFVNPDLAKEAANIMGVNDVWLSTGTFASGKSWDGHIITLSPVLVFTKNHTTTARYCSL